MTKVLGLTGGIAAGKTAVGQLFQARGAVLIDADQVARQVVQKSQPGLAEIVALFGTTILNAAGELDRSKLGRLVFSDSSQLNRLNAVIQPRIRQEIINQSAAYRAQGYPLVVVMIPLLYEMNYETICDAVLDVDIPLELQVKRVMMRDHLTIDEAKQRITAQLSREQRLSRADFILDTSGNLLQLQENFDELWDRDDFQTFLMS
ncbi:dephospho-coa kinase [Lapidilactobacillus concavus DSM 17758]|uniref:Dephospho-CoA kinase n=1 Tax=Lapidilactobacillus concavus DSM 17758 TaxID=1423735 RepID=A0A0R1W5R7_9LACO|nr:dephospho-CoA kinase [Lapidilactobacillus concavus]KRM11284.1 dephospho-coa kinase [Lapidilactobacillus concavus DSM 17758]GEL13468.1 dephospho-CoA kinase [Lapidilactobacillus concavus]